MYMSCAIIMYLMVIGVFCLAGLYSLYVTYRNGITVRKAAEAVLQNPSNCSVKKYLRTIYKIETLHSCELFEIMRQCTQKALTAPSISQSLKDELKIFMDQTLKQKTAIL